VKQYDEECSLIMHTSNRVGVSNITEYISHFVTLHCLRKLERFRNPDGGK